jgi:dihydroorotase
MNPPLRTWSDVEAVIGGLKDGTIEFIATDHAPHAREKKMREIDLAPFGIVGLETLVPITSLCLIEPGHLTWSDAIARMSCNPAVLLGLTDKGTLRAGADADVTLIDPHTRWTIDPSQFRSKSRNTPFGGWEVSARAHTVIVGGEVRYTRGGIVRQAGAAVPA